MLVFILVVNSRLCSIKIILPSLQVPVLVAGVNIMKMQLARSNMYAIHAHEFRKSTHVRCVYQIINQKAANYQTASEIIHNMELSG